MSRTRETARIRPPPSTADTRKQFGFRCFLSRSPQVATARRRIKPEKKNLSLSLSLSLSDQIPEPLTTRATFYRRFTPLSHLIQKDQPCERASLARNKTLRIRGTRAWLIRGNVREFSRDKTCVTRGWFLAIDVKTGKTKGRSESVSRSPCCVVR